MTKGYFISFEGIDGVGKSSQASLLADYLGEMRHRNVLSYREPGGTDFGEALRRVLKNPETSRTSLAEMLAFSAARAEGVEKVVRPALDRGEIVIADRFFHSTEVYQGICGRVDIDDLRTVTRIATGGLIPDLTFLIDADPNDAIKSDRDHYENKGMDFQRRLRAGFLKLFDENLERFRIIPYRKGDIEGMQGEIRGLVDAFLTTGSYKSNS